MKKLLFFLLTFLVFQFTRAQNVGIGTTTPNASAQLDVTSTTKGLLIPRMTSAERLAIASPVEGLMVYETTTSSFWFYNGFVWNQIGIGGTSPWTVSGTNIYNSNTGNVGIGTTAPTVKLHLAGSMLMNTTNPTVQFQQSGIDKVFVQASGDNLRIGTYSGNSTGKMIIRMDGTDRVFVDSIGQVGIGRTTPTERLDVDGKIRITPFGSSSVSDAELKLYANPFNTFNSLGPAQISYYNWQDMGGGNYNYNKKYKIEFEGGVSERLKMYNVDFPNQFVLDKDGDVGVNVSVPTEKLHVVGNAMIQGVNPILKIKTTSISSNFQSLIQFNSTTANLGNIAYTGGGLVLSGRDTTASGTVVPDLVIKNSNIGLGTSTPSEKLHIIGNMLVNYIDPTFQFQNNGIDKGFLQLNGNDIRIGTNSINTTGKFVVRTNGIDQVYVDQNGNMGFNVSTPLSRLHILTGDDASISSHGYLMLGSVTGSNVIFDNNEIMARSNGTASTLVLQNDGGAVRIGNVTVPSGYKFAINGKMICEEVKVKLSTAWPDYVFNETHQLMPIEKLSQFIQANKHLPNIPSAASVESNGIEVGDMQKKMMEKIEELTLYIIEQDKRIKQLEKQQNKSN